MKSMMRLGGFVVGFVLVWGAVHCSRAEPVTVVAAPVVAPTTVTQEPVVTPPVTTTRGPQTAPTAPQTIDLAHLPMRPEAPVVEQARSQLRKQDEAGALATAAGNSSAAAQLIRARVLRTAKAFDLTKPEVAAQLEEALKKASADPVVAPWAALERGHYMRSRNDDAGVVAALQPLLDGGVSRGLSRRAVVLYVRSLAVTGPQSLIDKRATLEPLLPSDDPDARSFFLDALAVAHEKLGHAEDARAARLQRYLEEPVSTQTPEKPPAGVVLTNTQIITRAEKLAEAHRSERVLVSLNDLPDTKLTPDLVCRKAFAMGLAARKLRQYTEAETHLTRAVSLCADTELKRRAHYLNAKVISVRDGMRAVPVIDAFAKEYGNHSMVDDVLFWAGDIYQRRSREKEAAGYYRRIEQMAEKGDHCGEARWRLAWMPYLAGDSKAARAGFERLLADDGCAQEVFDKARALYWLARDAEKRGDKKVALERYSDVMRTDPLEFYAQTALARMLQLDPERGRAAAAAITLPEGAVPPLQLGELATDPAFARAMELLSRGLGDEAAIELMSVGVPARQVMALAHATSIGETPNTVTRGSVVAGTLPESSHPRLIVTLLLDRAGGKAEAQWRLRTEFADILSTAPSAETAPIWRAAYPLAMREYLEAGEKESRVPPFFLQALAREESAFNEQVVSWAGAYGLTQLLLSTGRGASRLLSPPPKVTRAEDLLDPRLNARLGGALLSELLRKLGGSPALALAAYNAGEDVALTWWKRFQGQDFDVFAEEMTIKETRGYVKRVLRTYGIYRWMYAGAPPAIPVELTLPGRATDG